MLQTGFDTEEPLKNKEKLTIFGDSGTERYSGFFYEDPNPQWTDDRRIDIVENMRRTDGSVKAALTIVKTPILAANWDIVTDSEDPLFQEVTEFVKKSVFNLKGRTWKGFLREALTYLDFGFSVFEKIYGIREGRLTIVDLAPRIQRSIYKWEMQDGSPGVTQFLRTNEDDAINNLGNQGFLEIPAAKIVVFTNEKEGDDVTGQSILRAAYKHFYAKDNLYRFGLIASERFGAGTLVIGMPLNAGREEREAAKNIGQSFKANEMAYVVKPSPEWDLEILRPEGSSQNSIMEEQIKHHNREILMTVLAAFMDLGSGSSGSFALSKDQSSFFVKNIEDKVEYFKEEFTKTVLEDIVKQAYPDVYQKMKAEEALPYLTSTPVDEKDLKNTAEYIKILVDAGMINPDDKLKKWTRSLFKMPELTEEDLDQVATPTLKKDLPEEEEELSSCTHSKECSHQVLLGDKIGLSTVELLSQKKKFELARPLTLLEEHVNFEFLNEQFNDLGGDLAQELVKLFEKSIDRGMRSAQAKVKSGDLSGVSSISFVSKTELSKLIKKYTQKALEVGKKTASEELEVERPRTPQKTTQANNLEAAQIVEQVSTDLNGAVRQTARSGISNEVAVLAILVAMRRAAQKEADKATRVISGSIPGQHINQGRRVVFDDNEPLIQAYIRSEVLDSRTCNICMSLDGRVVKADDPFAKLDQVHNFCRGVWVAIGKEAKDATGRVIGVRTIDNVKGATLGIPKTIRERFSTVGGVPETNAFTQLKKPINRANKKVQDEIKRRDQA